MRNIDSQIRNLSIQKRASPAFIGGFRTLRKSRFGRAEAWAIYRTGEQIDRELERYFTIRKEIEERFAKTDGKSKFIPKECVPAFQQELEDLAKKHVELWLDHKVNLPEECMIEPDEMGALVEAGIIYSPDAATAGESGVEAPANPSPPASEAKPQK